MGSERFNMHIVSMHSEAAALIGRNRTFYVGDCGCRQSKSGCKRSRIDVCLHFAGDDTPGARKRRIAQADAEQILAEAVDKRLVARPFRNQEDPSVIDGICFCCDDCCSYFTDGSEPCDKGAGIESTSAEAYNQCGACVDACYFGARGMQACELSIDRERCYGCGLCVETCPAGCIAMVQRSTGI